MASYTTACQWRAVFACLATGVLLLALPGCRSAKPPPPKPVALAAAERTAREAEQLLQQENWAAAAQAWKRAADQYGLLNEQHQVAVAWHNYAEAQKYLGNFEDAHHFLEKAATLNEQLGRKDEWWRNQIALLQVESQRTNTTALAARFKSLQPAAAQLKNPSLSGLYLNELGLWQQREGALDEAAATFTRAEQQFQAIHQTNGIAAVIANQARLADAQTNYSAALNRWQVALKMFESQADPIGISAALAGLGRSQLALKHFAAAEDYLQRAAQNYRTLQFKPELAQTLELLVTALAAQHKPEAIKPVRAELETLK